MGEVQAQLAHTSLKFFFGVVIDLNLIRLHRYSLPSSNFSGHYRPNLPGYNAGAGLDSFAAAKSIFHDDQKPILKDEDRLSTPDIKSYIRMTEPDDKFPTLRRGGSNIVSLRCNISALDDLF